MTLNELLRDNEDTILARWVEGALEMYPEQAAVAFRRQNDPFANPVGHSLRVGTRGIFEALLEGWDDAKIRESLREIVRIRAVQEISPGVAVGFVFALKQAIRDDLGSAVEQRSLTSELAALDQAVDRVALSAFDVYAECREDVYRLRVEEVKRRVSWVVDKMNQRRSAAHPVPDAESVPAAEPELEPSPTAEPESELAPESTLDAEPATDPLRGDGT